MTFLYPAIKVIHILSIASWFGAGLAILYLVKAESAESQERTALTLIRNIQGMGAIVAVLAGLGMAMLWPDWLKDGWLHTKILLWIIALGLVHISGAKLKKRLNGEAIAPTVIRRFQIIGLVCMTISMILVEFKPF
jgi:putative membrane protein